MRPDADFWRGRRVLLTGHTGFKGAWLGLWLRRLGAVVHGYALPPATLPSLHALLPSSARTPGTIGDLASGEHLDEAVRIARPEVVLHLAAQPLVRAGYARPLETMAVNVMGTARLLEALRGCDGLRAVVVVTTDKVYRNSEAGWPFREDDPLGGHDPYSASKAAAELVAACWRDAFLAPSGVGLATARAGNVVGGGDWAGDRLLPDAVRAWRTGRELVVRRPQAVRPWQHVLEPLAGYLVLAERLAADPALGGAWNFGPATADAATVGDVVDRAARLWGDEARWSVPADVEGPHEAGHLSLEVARARARLGVAPRWGLDETLARTVRWYRRQADGHSALGLCEDDIDAYEAALDAAAVPAVASARRVPVGRPTRPAEAVAP